MDPQAKNDIPPPVYPPRRKTTERKWPKRILKPISFFLMTGDDTDTVDRLFVSKHVNDLRLITATVFVILILVMILAVAVAVSTAMVNPTSGVAATEAKHILDSSTAAGAVFFKLLAPTFAVFGAVLTWAYQTGSARLGVVDLFACEIDTLCRVIAVVDMVGNQTKLYTFDPLKTTPDGKGNTVSPAHFNSQEEYFPILANNSRDLQTLEANVVINITAFYTFMKAVRDTLRQLAEAKSATQWQESMRNVIYMLYLGLESGRNAMNDLVEFEPTHTERTMVILLSELDAYYFLRDKFRDPNEMHNERLILRGPTYATLVPKLNDILDCKARESLLKAKRSEMQNPTYEESQWLAALQSRNSLNTRFDRLKAAFPLECFATNDRLVTANISAN
jgi:hypothetical protein